MSQESEYPRPSWDREIRVFVSSTFRDMQEEREVLTKKVFPQLRKLCEERGATFTEVDLRWGVSDEQKAEGKVLPICLAEIERCRPFFIGLLGERYGWVSDEIPANVLQREDWAWIEEHIEGRTSVTELEILHGVLRDPAMQSRAFFYFRDPAYVAHSSLTEAQQRELKHGYYASVSLIGTQIGRVMAELERLKMRENTIIVLWGDHGWKLGEHNGWCKQTNYEIALPADLLGSRPSSQRLVV